MTSVPEVSGEDAIAPFDKGLILGLTSGGKDGDNIM